MKGLNEKNFYSMNLDHWTNQPIIPPTILFYS
jgi:hypothetical protein